MVWPAGLQMIRKIWSDGNSMRDHILLQYPVSRSPLFFALVCCIHGNRSISYQSVEAFPEMGLAESSKGY